MNILFINDTYPDPKYGGTSRSLLNISSYLVKHEFKIFVAYPFFSEGKNVLVSDSFKIEKNKDGLLCFGNFLNQNNITLVINLMWYLDKKIMKVIKDSACIFINRLSYDPLAHTKVSLNVINNPEYYYEPKHNFRRKFGFFYKHLASYIFKKRLLKMFDYSDNFIVLSEKFIPVLVDLLNLKDNDITKIKGINNSLSYPNQNIVQIAMKKENRVLIVSRMDDVAKRISLALNIWHHCFMNTEHLNWQLDIVGDGKDLIKIKNYVSNKGIKNVNFYSSQDPKSFYERARIFLMTSCTEGFSNCLIEAQQFGCIPVAFNSYEALHDIIIDGFNGFIFDEGDKNQYINKLIKLIHNPEILNSMLAPTVESTKKFDVNLIGPKWLEILMTKATI